MTITNKHLIKSTKNNKSQQKSTLQSPTTYRKSNDPTNKIIHNPSFVGALVKFGSNLGYTCVSPRR